MRDDKERLDKILEAIYRIKEYTKAGKDKFFAESMIQDAVVRNFQVLGEGIKDLSVDLKEKNPDIEWSLVARFRDKVIHHYLDINLSIVWDVVETKLDPLREKIEDVHRRLVYKVPGERESKALVQDSQGKGLETSGIALPFPDAKDSLEELANQRAIQKGMAERAKLQAKPDKSQEKPTNQ